MVANNKYGGIPGYLFKGFFALIFALVACLYLFRNDGSYNESTPAIVLDEFITEPLPPVIPGLWQMAY
jgi:hypothetical protein